jgi:putative ABC transport system permease protein
MTDYIVIGNFELAIGAALIAVNLGLSWALRLGLERTLLIAAVRMVVQLMLVGLVLEWVFATRHPLVILAIALAMSGIAAHAAVRRTRRRFAGVYLDSLVTILAASFLVTGLTLGLVLRPTPWFDPQYLVPLLGMLLGNGLTGISLGLDRFTEACAERSERIETLLALGATRWEAARSTIAESMRVGLMPTVNSMMVMGIVSLPGMMTGQILAGANPGDAVRYQILVIFMIAACTGLATFGVLMLAWLRLFSPRHRLLLSRLS